MSQSPASIMQSANMLLTIARFYWSDLALWFQNVTVTLQELTQQVE